MDSNTELINRTEVLMPPTVNEQTAIAEILGDMDAEIAALEGKLSKARQVKQELAGFVAFQHIDALRILI